MQDLHRQDRLLTSLTGESVMNDSELVAVITAAVAAASAGQNAYTTYPSKDKLVTRPIRRIKR